MHWVCGLGVLHRPSQCPEVPPLLYDRHLLGAPPVLCWREGAATETEETPAPESSCSQEQCDTDEKKKWLSEG